MLIGTINMFLQVTVYTYNRSPHILARHIQYSSQDKQSRQPLKSFLARYLH